MALNDSSGQLVFTERSIGSWIFAIFAILSGVFIVIATGSIVYGLPSLIIGLVILLIFGSTNTITADRTRRLLTVSRRSLFGTKTEEYPFSEIADFQVEASRQHTTRRHRNINYRLVLVKTSGDQVPLQSVFTSYYDDKARKAKALSEYLQVPGWQDKPTNLFQTAMQGQVALTAKPTLTQEGTTSGVKWTIEVHSVGGNPVTRWISSDFTCPDEFVLISQKPAGSPAANSGGGILGNLMLMAYRQVLGLYGFLPGDTPRFENAKAINTPDPVFNQNFYALASDESLGDSYINHWTIIPLKNWAERHPLKNINTRDQFGQLAVLFSPRGVQAAVLGAMERNQTDELIDLGVEMVKTQGGGKLPE
jgi:hypothetical protein